MAFGVLAAIGFCHFLNDLRQSVIPAVYPILKEAYRLDFRQIGLITLSVQLTASLLQPFVGIYTDHRPTPYSLPVGMGFTLSGLLLLAFAPRFGMILLAVALVGVGSSVFHPESSRVARMASGGQHGGRWARCWPRWSYFREASAASRGSPRRRCLPLLYWRASGPGTRATARLGRKRRRLCTTATRNYPGGKLAWRWRC